MAPSAIHSFIGGIRASLTRYGAKALAWCYLSSIGTTSLFFIPFFLYIRSTVAGSAMATELRGGQIPDWIVDLGGTSATGAAIGTFAIVAILLVPVYLLLVVALTGGVLENLAVALGLRTRPRPFLVACGDLVGPTARIVLVEAPAVGLLVFVLSLVRGALELVGSSPVVAWGWLATLVLLVAFVTTFFDFARIRLYLVGDRAALRSLGDTFRFTFSHFWSVLGLVVLNSVVAMLIFIGFVWLHSRVPLDTAAGIVVGILAGQLSIGARLWWRIAAFGAEAALWSSCNADHAKNLD
jgi:hypothetical protein